MITNRLRALRTAHRWTQAELADLIDVSRQTVVSLENGRCEPTLKVAMRLSAVFEQRIEDIFTADPADLAHTRTRLPGQDGNLAEPCGRPRR
ncbi:MAG: helix-turn-helix transcriptional regulator [Microbacterium sp.]